MSNSSVARVPSAQAKRRAGVLLPLAVLLMACGQVAACGGSSDNGSSSTAEGGTDGSGGGSEGGKDATAGDSSDGSMTNPSDGSTDGADGATEAGNPTACAELNVPLANSDGANTNFVYNLPTAVDLTGATMNVQVWAPGATGGLLIPYVQQGSPNYGQNFLNSSNPTQLKQASSWTTLSYPIMGVTTSIQRIGLSIQSGSNGNADAGLTFQQPSTIVYLGMITITGASTSVGPFYFNSSSSVQTSAAQKDPTDQIWLNVDDKPVAGAYVVFDPTCGTPAPYDAGVTTEGGSDASPASDGSSEASTTTDASSEASTTTDASSEASTTTDAASEASQGGDDASAMDDASDAATTPACPPGLSGGCAVLTVPLSGSGQKAWFDIDIPTTDMTGATITAQVIAPNATAGVIQAFVQQGSPNYTIDALGWQNLTGATTWTTLSWTVSKTTDTAEQRVALSVESGTVTGSTVFEQPATVVYVNNITVTLGAASTSTTTPGPWTFPAANSISSSQYANVLWLDTSDTPVAGTTLTWLQ